MREIKFRLWCKDLEEMIEINKMGFENNELWYIVCIDHDKEETYFPENDDHVLMQYTGLKDKNSKEIYEGDIVKTASLDEYSVIDTGKPAVVIIDNFSWMLKQGDEPDYFEFLSNLQNNLIVIGNIYENPELLGGVGE